MRISITLLLSFSLTAFAATNDTSGLNLDWRDLNVSPQHDFYHYANGGWQAKHPIPADRASWGAFSVLQEKNEIAIRQILVDAANNKQVKSGSIEQKIGDFYFSGMDVVHINQLGATPLQPEFDRIAAIKTLADLQATIVHLQMAGIDVPFNIGSMQDFKDSQHMIGALMQGGLSLPDRDYYLKTEPKFQQIRTAFINHIQTLFTLIGESNAQAKQDAATIMRLETALAKASMSQTAQRDPYAVYHIKTLAELHTLAPQLNWAKFFTELGLPQLKHINVGMPEFVQVVNQLMTTVPLADWQTYLRWHLLASSAPYLSQPFVDANFKFSSIITGAQKNLPRWKRVVATENSLLGFAIGEIYVKRYFSKEAKQEILSIIQNIRQALKDDLQQLPWMTPATRQAALAKLNAMKERIGYPNKWWDYSALDINRGPYVLNVLRASQFLVRRDLNKIDKPVDYDEWDMSPQTVNAYYSPSMNNINLPTGILQPPFFDPNAPESVNYGAMGFVIGHEITHGFDDQGSKFDGQGNLRDWWTAEDLKRFTAATQCIVKQFSSYTVGDAHVQGELVVGEATADLGGLMLAYRAFHASKAYKEAKTIAGLTPDQQFFLGAAHVWAQNIRPQQAHNLVIVDPHPPAQYRVNGTLANMPQFQAAFNVSKDSPMVNKELCVIW